MIEKGAATHIVCDQNLVLSPEKALFWIQKKTLIISDVHLGKASHFRKSGIAVPGQVHLHDLYRIDQLIQIYKPNRIIFLGDLFHSDHNMDWHQLNSWLHDYPEIHFVLVRGNHDILPESMYIDSPIELVDSWKDGPFLFTHDAEETIDFNISGHIHPAVRLSGTARQSVKIPCFHFSSNAAVLPAFGVFTGFVNVKVVKGDEVFGLTKNKVLHLTA